MITKHAYVYCQQDRRALGRTYIVNRTAEHLDKHLKGEDDGTADKGNREK